MSDTVTYIAIGIAVVSGVLYFMRRRSRLNAEDND
jgi:LPXTG-motif cell wall-anchored protein